MNLCVVIGPGAAGLSALLIWGLFRAAAASEQLDRMTAKDDGEYLA